MNAIKHIQQYISQATNGLVSITQTQAADILDIAYKQSGKTNAALAKLYKYEAQTGNWQFVRTIQVTDEQVKDEIITALSRTPAKQFYRYECYNSTGQFEGNIETVNPCLF